MTQDTEDVVARLQERLLKAAAYVEDHKGLMLEDDQYDALATDLRHAASTIQSLSDRIDVDLHGAFMAGWLARHSSDAQPEDAWAIYRAALHQEHGSGE